MTLPRDIFTIEILYKPSIPDNIPNLNVFYDDEHILHFMANVDVLKDTMIDDTKTQSYTLMHEHINLGTNKDLKFFNLSTSFTSKEKQAFVYLFRQYCDVFMWTYDDLKTYDTWIIQHIILTREGVKPFQQKLRKVHLSLEPSYRKN